MIVLAGVAVGAAAVLAGPGANAVGEMDRVGPGEAIGLDAAVERGDGIGAEGLAREGAAVGAGDGAPPGGVPVVGSAGDAAVAMGKGVRVGNGRGSVPRGVDWAATCHNTPPPEPPEGSAELADTHPVRRGRNHTTMTIRIEPMKAPRLGSFSDSSPFCIGQLDPSASVSGCSASGELAGAGSSGAMGDGASGELAGAGSSGATGDGASGELAGAGSSGAMGGGSASGELTGAGSAGATGDGVASGELAGAGTVGAEGAGVGGSHGKGNVPRGVDWAATRHMTPPKPSP